MAIAAPWSPSPLRSANPSRNHRSRSMQGQSAIAFPLLGALLSVAIGGCAMRNEPPPISAAAAVNESTGGYPVSGQYRGEGLALNDPGGFCSSRMEVTNWVVTGNRVSFGSFNGTIQ